MKKILIMFLISSLISLAGLFYVNYIVLNDSTNSIISSTNTNTSKSSQVINIPTTFSHIGFNKDGNKFLYISNETVCYSDLNGSNKSSIDEEHSICYAKFLDNNNIVYTIHKNGYLYVKRFIIENNESITIATMPIKNLNAVENIWNSNNKFIVETNVSVGDKKESKLYSIDQGEVNPLSIKGTLDKGAIINNEFVYSNTVGNVYIGQTQFKYNDFEEFQFLDTNFKDKLYLLDKKSGNKILDVSIGKSTIIDSVLNIEVGSIEKSLYTDSLYLIYKDKAIDVINNQNIDISKDSSILYISKDKTVYKDNNNRVYLEKNK